MKGASRSTRRGGRPTATHEPFVSHRTAPPGSDRAFGLTFAAFFILIGFWPALAGRPPRLWALAIACIFLIAAGFFVAALAPLNRAWSRLGTALHHVTTPILFAALYFGMIVPSGLILRALGKDPLRLKPAPAGASYWIRREPSAPERGSMSRQY